jgi:alanine racemase
MVIKAMTHSTHSSGRPTVAEIDLGALRFNYLQIRRRIPKAVDVLGVVKANAYGHGAVPVALKLQKLGVGYLGVAIVDEGIELRKGGVRTPVLVMGGVFKEEADQILAYGLTPVVFEKDSLRILSKAVRKHHKKIKIHLKVDTGMGRLGVSMNSWPALLQELKRYPGIEIEGILSHFSMTEDEEGVFTARQWDEFQKAVAIARGSGVCFKYLHMANSANLTVCPSYCGNLVRPGIMLYGAYPSPTFQDRIKLEPVMTLKTAIRLLKSVPGGARIGYGGTFTTKKKSIIATLPIGYADGYRRCLSNRGEVLVRRKRAPVIGRVSMDYTLVDVTDIPGVSVGDEVVLIGKQGRERITADEMAEKTDSISYEVLCLIGQRVPRIYKDSSQSELSGSAKRQRR